MKTAVNSFRRSVIIGSTDIDLGRRPKMKAQRLSRERRLGSKPEQGAGEIETQKPEDSSLDETIRLAQQGDGSAFELIYRLHCRRVYALCMRMVRDPSEAEDLTQETFIQLFRKISTFRGESAFSSWLHRLTINVVLRRLRKRKLMPTSLDEISTSSNGENDETRKDIGGPDLRLTGLFDRINLRAAINQLPEGSKAMFILHDVHGYRHNEIAVLFGCSIGNSKSQVHKARKRMREFLRKIQPCGGQHNRGRGDRSVELVVSYSHPPG